MVMEADKWLPQNGKSGRGRDQDYKAQEETCKGDGYVIILNVVLISQECKHQIVYFKHVQLTVCQLCLNKAVKKKNEHKLMQTSFWALYSGFTYFLDCGVGHFNCLAYEMPKSLSFIHRNILGG